VLRLEENPAKDLIIKHSFFSFALNEWVTIFFIVAGSLIAKAKKIKLF